MQNRTYHDLQGFPALVLYASSSSSRSPASVSHRLVPYPHCGPFSLPLPLCSWIPGPTPWNCDPLLVLAKFYLVETDFLMNHLVYSIPSTKDTLHSVFFGGGGGLGLEEYLWCQHPQKEESMSTVCIIIFFNHTIWSGYTQEHWLAASSDSPRKIWPPIQRAIIMHIFVLNTPHDVIFDRTCMAEPDAVTSPLMWDEHI